MIGIAADCSEPGNRAEGGNPPRPSPEKVPQGQALRSWEKSYGVTTPRHPAGTETQAKAEARWEPAKVSRNSARSRHASRTQILPSCASRAARDLAELLGQSAPLKEVGTYATAARWVAAR